MANVLDLLRDLVERPSEREEYREDPHGYVRSHGRTDLTGEDVATALEVVRDLVPADLAASLAARSAESPAVAPEPGEEPLDAALRYLDHVVAAVADGREAPPRPEPAVDAGDFSVEGSDAHEPIPMPAPEPAAEDTSERPDLTAVPDAEQPDAEHPDTESGITIPTFGRSARTGLEPVDQTASSADDEGEEKEAEEPEDEAAAKSFGLPTIGVDSSTDWFKE